MLSWVAAECEAWVWCPSLNLKSNTSESHGLKEKQSGKLIPKQLTDKNSFLFNTRVLQAVTMSNNKRILYVGEFIGLSLARCSWELK